MIDALGATGSVDDVRARIREHHDAATDHVALQVVGAGALPHTQWRELAALVKVAT